MEVNEEIDRILKTKDLYEVLDVSKSVLNPELRLKFKELALACKSSSHPRRKEAFSAVTWAFHILSNKEYRSEYDKHGEKALPKDAKEYDPETIFEEVIQGERKVMSDPETLFSTLRSWFFKALPLLIILLYYAHYRWKKSRPFSLYKEPVYGFTVQRWTKDQNVSYYVSSAFNETVAQNRKALAKLEARVQEAHLQDVKDKANRAQAVHRARAAKAGRRV